eukprot:SAG31_NODE_884_length_11256_cov_2.889666_6_plen_221_part_00
MEPYRAALRDTSDSAAHERRTALAAHAAAAAAEPKVSLPPVAGRWHFKANTNWFAPELPAGPGVLPAGGCVDLDDGAAALLSPGQVGRWHTEGLLVLQDLFPRSLCEEATSCVSAGNRQAVSQFPYDASANALNRLTLHPNLLRAVAQLLDTTIDDLRLYNAHTMLKSTTPNGRAGSTTALHGEQPHFAFGEQGLHQGVFFTAQLVCRSLQCVNIEGLPL